MIAKTLLFGPQRLSHMRSKQWVSFLLIIAACSAPGEDVSSYTFGFPFDSLRYKGEEVEMAMGGLDPLGLFFNLCLWFLVLICLQRISKKYFLKKKFLISILAFLHIYSLLYVFSPGVRFAMSQLATEKGNKGYVIYAVILGLSGAVGLLFWALCVVTYRTERRNELGK